MWSIGILRYFVSLVLTSKWKGNTRNTMNSLGCARSGWFYMIRRKSRMFLVVWRRRAEEETKLKSWAGRQFWSNLIPVWDSIYCMKTVLNSEQIWNNWRYEFIPTRGHNMTHRSNYPLKFGETPAVWQYDVGSTMTEWKKSYNFKHFLGKSDLL